jgi:hypothetical protein
MSSSSSAALAINDGGIVRTFDIASVSEKEIKLNWSPELYALLRYEDVYELLVKQGHAHPWAEAKARQICNEALQIAKASNLETTDNNDKDSDDKDSNDSGLLTKDQLKKLVGEVRTNRTQRGCIIKPLERKLKREALERHVEASCFDCWKFAILMLCILSCSTHVAPM